MLDSGYVAPVDPDRRCLPCVYDILSNEHLETFEG